MSRARDFTRRRRAPKNAFNQAFPEWKSTSMRPSHRVHAAGSNTSRIRKKCSSSHHSTRSCIAKASTRKRKRMHTSTRLVYTAEFVQHDKQQQQQQQQQQFKFTPHNRISRSIHPPSRADIPNHPAPKLNPPPVNLLPACG